MNIHLAEQRLREAAAEFSAHLFAPVRDQHDRMSQRLNRRLLRAARVYASLTTPIPLKPRRRRKESRDE